MVITTPTITFAPIKRLSLAFDSLILLIVVSCFSLYTDSPTIPAIYKIIKANSAKV
jgi:hypothetical protein